MTLRDGKGLRMTEDFKRDTLLLSYIVLALSLLESLAYIKIKHEIITVQAPCFPLRLAWHPSLPVFQVLWGVDTRNLGHNLDVQLGT